MDIGKCMHGNGPECERCKAMDIPEVEEMEVTITELRAEVERLRGEVEEARVFREKLGDAIFASAESGNANVATATARAEASEKEVERLRKLIDSIPA